MNNLKEFRIKANLSQFKLAELCGWTKPNQSFSPRIANYESGHRTPSLSDSRRMVRVLNENGAKCTLDQVFPPNNNKKAA